MFTAGFIDLATYDSGEKYMYGAPKLKGNYMFSNKSYPKPNCPNCNKQIFN